jgi:hypothetical protein
MDEQSKEERKVLYGKSHRFHPVIPFTVDSAPWRPLFLTLPLAEAGGVLPLDTCCDSESLEFLPAESLGQEVGRHVVCGTP